MPGALRHPKIATIATKKTAGMMKMDGFMFLRVCVKRDRTACEGLGANHGVRVSRKDGAALIIHAV
jgi:hypothetical protein